jgi:small subunit ribosomal protein S8e
VFKRFVFLYFLQKNTIKVQHPQIEQIGHIVRFINSPLVLCTMAIERTRSTRKLTGGRYQPNRKGRQYARVHTPTLTKIGELDTFVLRTRGGGQKVKILSANTINVSVPKDKKTVVATITDVLSNGANRNFVIRDIYNKGAVLQTSIGKVVVTSRPGQTGNLSGKLVE